MFSLAGELREGPTRYRGLRRNLIIVMLAVTLVPLLLMAIVNYHQYRSALASEVLRPMRLLTNRTKHSFEVFLAERLSTLNFIASAYSFEELTDEKTLNRVFRVMKKEFTGFVDLGLIDQSGIQVSYVGPYDVKGKNYTEQSWFREVHIRGSHISDVFLGYREFPHVVMAVQYATDTGHWWILRATIDTKIFNDLIATMGVSAESDVFLINDKGILQSDSKFYGKLLDTCPLMTVPSFEANVTEQVDPFGKDVLVTHAKFINAPLALVVVTPQVEVLKTWYALKGELVYLLLGSVVVIFVVVFRLSQLMVRRIQESDEKREAAFRELEHTHKLSSIGRLAAGVAHEVNNPMAIINEKAGLIKDLIEFHPEFIEKERFLAHLQGITGSVDRCRSITHRLLGFARRMEVQVEVLDVNEVIHETMGFLEKEALYRNIEIRYSLDESLPRIASDRAQLQQALLNILSNALAAVDDEGTVTITSWERGLEHVAVSIQDNGRGMDEETVGNIFEPFFTTKRGYGTGLGLSITYGIIQKLGGEIRVQSKLNEGSTFSIFLPRKSDN